MALFWAADALGTWAGLAMFGVQMNAAALFVGFATGMVFTRRTGPLAGAGVLALILPLTIWDSGAPLAVTVAGVFVYRVLALLMPMPVSLAALPCSVLNQEADPAATQPSRSANRPPRAQVALSGSTAAGRATDRRPLPARKLVDDHTQFAQTCQDSASGIVDACGPGSPDSHRVVWGLTSRPPVPPAGFPPVSRLPAGFSPFARLPLVSLRPAFSGSSPSAVARVPVPLRFPSGFPSLEQSSR